MAIFWSLLFHLTLNSSIDLLQIINKMSYLGILINIILMIFNLIPIPPLDGGRILQGMLPFRTALKFAKIEPYGIWIIIGLAFSGLLKPIIFPLLSIFLMVLT